MPQPRQHDGNGRIAVMLTGGGARAAYQVGLIRGLARHFPELQFQIVTGVSAGAINAMFLAGRRGTLTEKAEHLSEMWCALHCSSIWHFDWWNLLPFRSAVASVFWRHRWSRWRSSSTTSSMPGRGSPSPESSRTSATGASAPWL
ncbi:MAG TPA: patatin-like phospholipase family protein [Thermoanaerobaculia bacterium]|nr:patatin-like phospholipase family protein [Thermoanaerobaculia bacterium]